MYESLAFSNDIERIAATIPPIEALNTENTPKPIVVKQSIIESRSFMEKASNIWPYSLLYKAKDALRGLPQDKHGLVVGVGENHQTWTERGWWTNDINLTLESTVAWDANFLSQVVSSRSLDYLYAEYLTFSKVTPSDLIRVANQVLKDRGVLIISTVSTIMKEESDQNKVPIPPLYQFLSLLQKSCFFVIAETGEIITHSKLNDPIFRETPVHYFCFKLPVKKNTKN